MTHNKSLQITRTFLSLTSLTSLSMLVACADASKFKSSAASTSAGTSISSSVAARTSSTAYAALAAQPVRLIQPTTNSTAATGTTAASATANARIAAMPAAAVQAVIPARIVSPAQAVAPTRTAAVAQPIVVAQPATVVQPRATTQPVLVVAQPQSAPVVSTQCWAPGLWSGQGTNVTKCPSIAGLNEQQLADLIKPQLESLPTIAGDTNGTVSDSGTLTGQLGAVTSTPQKLNHFTPSTESSTIFSWGAARAGLQGVVISNFSVDEIIKQNRNMKKLLCKDDGSPCDISASLTPALNPGDVITLTQQVSNWVMNENKNPNFAPYSYGTISSRAQFQAARTITYTGKAIPAGAMVAP